MTLPATATQFSPADQARRAGLRRMRIVASSLLVVAALIYLLTLRHVEIGWIGFVNAAAEAAMVGACADWFAVTALFRHPFGIPIPHTALIRRRKADLGRSLADFVANYFLTDQVVTDRLASAQVGRRLGDWLAVAENRQRVLRVGATTSVTALGRMKADDVRGLVEEALLPQLQAEELAPVLGTLLEGVVADGAHQSLVDIVAREVHAWLRANPDAFAAVVGERAPRWSPRWLDRSVVGYAYDQAVGWVADIRDRRDHPVRGAVDDLLATLAGDLQRDPQVRSRAEALKQRVLTHPQMGGTIVSLWNALRSSLVAALQNPQGDLWRRADSWLADFADRLQQDPALRAVVEQRAQEAAVFLARSYGPPLASTISWTVERWDAREASDRIELFVGRDLQFIRINGTVVGALVGTLIHAVTLLLS